MHNVLLPNRVRSPRRRTNRKIDVVRSTPTMTNRFYRTLNALPPNFSV